MFGLAIGLAGGLGLASGKVFGLAIGLLVGLAYGLVSFAASPTIAQRASSPVGSQRDDRRFTVLVASAVGVAGGLACGLVGGLVIAPMGGLERALEAGVTGGLVFGVAFGLVGGLTNRAWSAFLVAWGWLAVRRCFPPRLMTFLEDAYRLGLLRVVGSAYQFRHAELQDHLAPYHLAP